MIAVCAQILIVQWKITYLIYIYTWKMLRIVQYLVKISSTQIQKLFVFSFSLRIISNRAYFLQAEVGIRTNKSSFKEKVRTKTNRRNTTHEQ